MELLNHGGRRITTTIEDLKASEMPNGWIEAFGDLLVEEINSVNPDIEILQIKEKFGSLRFYYAPASDEIDEIISKYECLSAHICASCGKPDVPQTKNGWIYPICRDCYEKNFSSSRRYDEDTSSQSRMPDEYTSVRYEINGDKMKKIKHRYDISKDAEKIRARYEGRKSV